MGGILKGEKCHLAMSFSFTDYSELGELPPRSPLEPVCEDGPFGPVPEEKKKTSRELRELWRKAILQQILLLRMEKENQKLQGWFGVGSQSEPMVLVDPFTQQAMDACPVCLPFLSSTGPFTSKTFKGIFLCYVFPWHRKCHVCNF